ncbi:MAG: DUF2891 domain-containing protein [Bacteroidetes bacterium]|nr:DUF2891 domain-containing protein [Bacteroidota bacterium]
MKRFIFNLFILLFILPIGCNNVNRNQTKDDNMDVDKINIPVLDIETANHLSKLAYNCISREYPNKLSHVMNDSTEVLGPETLHPAFYGCFDWHSSVHGHWMLVKLLKSFPNLELRNDIIDTIDKNITKESIGKEVEYIHQASRKSFERTYGWAWLLKLAEELYSWDDPQGNKWFENLQPLADAIANRYIEFLPKQTYPIRRGVHPNTAFGMSFALDWAQTSGNKELEKVLIERSIAYYINDINAPASWEPDGDDFLSPSLQECDLMRRVLNQDNFTKWFDKYLPVIVDCKPQNLLEPAIVGDRSDPKIVHLDGLNLSRAWCMFSIANALPDNHPAKEILFEAGKKHTSDALSNITSGNYEGEHWLASFAVYMFTTLE